jgi:LPS-assembly lipoprotein
MSIKHILVISLSALLVSACGFHLKGNLPLPETLNVIKLQAPKGDFRDVLSDALTNAGGSIVEDASVAEAIVKIVDYSTETTAETLDERGKANSRRIRLTVEYELLTPDMKLYRESTLKESQFYEYDPLNVLQSEQSEIELVEAMEQDIAIKLLRQLSIMTDYPNRPMTDSKKKKKKKEDG